MSGSYYNHPQPDASPSTRRPPPTDIVAAQLRNLSPEDQVIVLMRAFGLEKCRELATGEIKVTLKLKGVKNLPPAVKKLGYRKPKDHFATRSTRQKGS